jgi:RNA polymerase sigma-70 factor (ECF subfamily)
MTLESESRRLQDATDRVLVRLILDQGSEPAFRALYQRHTPRLFRVAVRMLVTEADAEDAVQEAWIRAVDRLRDFEWRSAFGTWLTSIGVNIARDVLERRGRWQLVELEDDVLWQAGPAIPESIDLERAIASLPAGCRAAFVLHDIEGFTHEEIAHQLGYAAGTSKSQVFRARRALRRLLGGAAIEETTHGT